MNTREYAKSGKQDDSTLAPYFYIAGGSPDEDLLPLKETTAAGIQITYPLIISD